MSTFEGQWKARDYPKAAATLEKALALARDSGSLDDLIEVRDWLFSAYEILGEMQKAVRFGEETLAIVRQNRDHFANPFGLPPDSVQPLPPETNYLDLLGSAYAKLGNYSVALKYLRETLAIYQAAGPATAGAGTGKALHQLGVALYLSGDVPGAEKAFREGYQSLREFNALVSKTGETNANEIESLRWLERVLVDQGRTDEALEMAQRSRAGSLGVFLASRFGRNLKSRTAVPNLEQIRRIAAEERATLVEYSIAYEANPVIPLQFSNYEMLPAAALFIWVVQPSGQISFRKVVFGKQGVSLAGLVVKTRDSMGARGRGAAPLPGLSAGMSRQILQEMYSLLIAPIEDLLPADPDARVILVPQDLLYLVPFAALQDQAGRYFVEKHTLTTEISLETLQSSRLLLQQLSPQVAGALVVGNPAMPRGLPPLDGAEKGGCHGRPPVRSRSLTGGQATKSAVGQRTGGSRIIHLATHGLLDGGVELLSALALAPSAADLGFLPAREIRLEAQCRAGRLERLQYRARAN